MTKNQIIVIVSLGLVNACIFCIVAPLLLLQKGNGSNREAVALSINTPTAFSFPPTDIPSSPTPAATNTLVLGGPARPTNAPPITPRALEAGWKFFDLSKDGFGIALPPNWTKVDFDRARLADLIQTMNAKNPDFAAALANQSNLVATTVQFFGFDFSNDALASGFVTNINVVRDPLTFAVPLDTYVQLSLQNMDKVPSVSKTITHQRVKVAAGDAEQVHYQLTLVGSKGNVTTVTTQYLFVHQLSAYIITFTTLPDNEKSYLPVFQKIIQTVQWSP